MAINFNEALAKAKALEVKNKKFSYDKDDRFIAVTRDESKNGSLLLRFLPDKNMIPAIEKFSHFGSHKVDGEKKWFIAECPTTVEEKCPFCEEYLKAWKYKDDDALQVLKPAKRKQEYVSNVLCIKDPGNPENEGKVFLLKYGFTVNKMIQQAIDGDTDLGIEPINIFNPGAEGSNFLLKYSPQGENITLDGSKFLNQSAICKTEKEIKDLLEKTYDLEEYKSEIKFLTYEQLERKLFNFKNGFYPDEDTEQENSEQENPDRKDPLVSETKKIKKEVVKTPTETKVSKATKTTKTTEPPKESSESSSDDDELDDFFSSL